MVDAPDAALRRSQRGERRRDRLVAIAIGLAALALYLPGIGAGDFVGDDESLDAGVVSEIHRSGDWLFPEFNGEYLPPKPPLFYWAAAAVSQVHGAVDEWSVRVPSALAGGATVVLTVAAATPLLGIGRAAAAGAMLATMPVFFAQSRAGRCDMLLALCVTAALLLAAQPTSGPRRWVFWTALGLAALTKGGAGVGLVVVVLVAAAIVERDASRIRRLLDPGAMAASILVGGSWYVAAAWHWGRRFVDEQIVGENFHHLVGGSAISDVGSGSTPLAEHLVYYLAHLPLSMFPWALLVPLVFFGPLRGRAPHARFFVIWLVAGLGFFTVVSRKSPYYLLPLAPAAALVASAAIHEHVRRAYVSRAFTIWITLRGALALAAGSVLVWFLAAHLPGGSCASRAAAEALGSHPFASVAEFALLGTALVLGATAVAERHSALGFAAAVACLVASLGIAARVDGPTSNCGSLKAFARDVAAHVGSGERLFFFRSPLPAVALYAKRRIPTVRVDGSEPSPPFYLIVPDSLAPDVPENWMSSAETVASARGRVFTRRPMTVRLLEIRAPSRNEGDEVPLGPLPGAQEARKP